MKFELVRASTVLGEYQGLYCEVDPTKIAIHVHGTWGNFYENSIATAFAEVYARHGYSYASVNVPGRDAESIGEDFDASQQVLSDWLERLAPSAARVIWQGHSLGALKVVRRVLDGIGEAPQAVVLLSPFDIRSFNARSSDERVIDEKLRSVLAGNREALVDSSIFDVWPISNGTYAACLDAYGPLAVFPSGQGAIGAIGNLQVPALAFIGSDDFAQSPDAESAANVLAAHGSRIRTELIGGAPHNFAGTEAEVSSRLDAFLSALN